MADAGAERQRGARARVAGVLTWLLVLILVPVAALVMLEGALILADVGRSYAPFDDRTFQGQTFHVRNPAFKELFVTWEASSAGTFAVPEHKPATTYRIFVFGGSAAEGWPTYKGGFSPFLEIELEASYPGIDFEVFNFAMAGVDSYAMRALAAACTEYKADLFVVYMGNNEFLGGFADGVPPPAWRAQWLIRLKQSRLMQLLGGMIPLRALPFFVAQSVQERPRQPGTAFVEAVKRNFADNLVAICEAGKAAGAEVILSTVAVNLCDWPPAKSAHLRELSPAQLVSWEKHFASGNEAHERGAYETALEAYYQALEIDDTYAELHFVLGECQSALGNFEAAKEHFEQAATLDSYEMARCRPYLNDVIRESAHRMAGRGTLLVDAAAALNAASPGGVTGAQLIPDACHPSFEGNYLLAQAFAARIREILPPGIAACGEPPFPKTSLEESLLLFGEQSVPYGRVMDDLLSSEMDFTPRLRARIVRARDRLLTLEEGVRTRDRVQALKSALERYGPCAALLNELVLLLMHSGLGEKAVPYGELAARIYPHWPETQALWCQLLLSVGENERAYQAGRAARQLFPHHPKLLYHWVQACVETGRADEADAALRAYLEVYPKDTAMRECLDQCTAAAGGGSVTE